jgi:fructosamine-3-kinase
VKAKIENILGQSIESYSPCSGGCISDAYVVRADKNYFLKMGSKSDMYHREEEGLKEMAQAIKVPKVYEAGDDYILMEYISPGKAKKDSFKNLGRDLAKLHQFRGEKFGLSANNYIGSTVQINTPSDCWWEFYLHNRLLFQLKLAETNNLATKEMAQGIARLERIFPELLKTDESPSLLHGDLWSGNFLIDDKGDAWLIDPAVYYGNREAEFGMITLFGGFNQDFFSGYEEVFPLEKDWKKRSSVYRLYHLLNHLNLFGSSYYLQVMEALNSSLR